MISRSLLLATSLLLSFLAAASFEAGYAEADITPGKVLLAGGDVYMGGYGFWTDRGPANAIHDPLTARTICLRLDTTGVCLAVLDSLGIPQPLARQIAENAARQTGLRADNIIIAATHTHAAPDLLGLWGGSPEEYQTLLQTRTEEAIISAWQQLQKVNLRYATATAPARNRRGWAFTDNELLLLQALKEDGSALFQLVNFAAHPVVTPSRNLSISSDFVHYLRKQLEQDNSAPVVYVNGAIGDVSPVREQHNDYWLAAEAYALSISQKTASLTFRQIDPVDLVFERADFSVPVDNLVLGLAQWLGLLNDQITGTPWNLSVNTSVSYLRLGSALQAVTVPGESLTRHGQAIKSGLSAPARLFIGLGQGSLGYFVPADEWQTDRNNNYEESVSLGVQTADTVTGQLMELIQRDEQSVEAQTHRP